MTVPRDDETTPEIPPHTTEHHRAGYDYTTRFPALRRFAGAEGGTVYTADAPDGFYVVTDEGALADFLDDDLPFVTVRRFDTRDERDTYCRIRFSRLRRDRHGS